MMKEILITSSALILALLVIRRVFRSVLSRRFQYALWGLVLARLLLPVSLPAADFSLLTAARPVEQAVDQRLAHAPPVYLRPVEQLPISAAPDAPGPQDDSAYVNWDPVRNMADGYYVQDPGGETVTRYAVRMTAESVLTLIWKAGMVLMGGFFLLSNLRFYWRLRKTRTEWRGDVTPLCGVLTDDPSGRPARKVYLVPEGVIPSPCLFGRSIYLTPAAAEDSARLRHILVHEEVHARHWDPLWSLLRCVCLTVYWFHPLVWVAAACSRTDCELACDETALNLLGEAERIPYGQTLLSLIPVKRASNPMITATTMTAGKRQLRDRVKRIAQRPRQLMAAALAVAVLAGVVSACTFTGAKGETTPDPVESQAPQELRALTGEELRWFNEEFFNGREQDEYGYSPYNLRNQFANPINLYDKPEDMDLYELFYLEGSAPSDEELRTILDTDPNELPCPAYKLTTQEINDILTRYTGLTLEEANRESLTYQYDAGTDAYYWMHGDTNYPGDIEVLCGTREGTTVKLYHHGWSGGSAWYCTTLRDRADGVESAEEESRYWFLSNQECEKPAIPTPLPAGEPEVVIPLRDLKPYVAPTVTVEPHVGDFDGSSENRLGHWSFDGHSLMVYRATDGSVYAAIRQADDTMNVFLTLPSEDCSLSFFHDLFGHDGFYLHYTGATPGDYYSGGEGYSYDSGYDSGYGSIYDYFYIDSNGVPVRLLRNPSSGSAQVDLNGDGRDELLSARGFFFQREGQIYQADFSSLTDQFPGQIEYRSFDPYGKYFYARGYTGDYKDWTRYLYFDGESVLVYKTEKPTVDHMVEGVAEGVPQAVVQAARDFAQRTYEASQTPTAPEPEGEQYAWGDPAVWDDWRVEGFDGPYTYSYGGATVEGWWFNYELHTTTPENVVLAGGRYITEDDWVSPGYPYCDALFFEVKDGAYRLLDSRMAQESPESYAANERVIQMMEEEGVELTDGSTYAGLWFQKRLESLTDPSLAGEEMRIQYDDGQGNGGAYIVYPQEGNGPYYLDRMRSNYVVWSRAEAPAAPPAGPTVIFSDLHWYDMLQFWQDSGLVMYKMQNQEPEWYEVQYDGDPSQDVFAYRAYPYYQARRWFDEAEASPPRETGTPAIEDRGRTPLDVAREWAETYEGVLTGLSPGGTMTCSYIKVVDVEVLEDVPESWFPPDILAYPHFAFFYDTIFVPENQDALYNLMAGNTVEYGGNDPDVPDGAYRYSRMGSMYQKDGYWYCAGVGTG